jgi:ElaB/YqjD/DUF883 family membrane-anchored ribosome-binding protein
MTIVEAGRSHFRPRGRPSRASTVLAIGMLIGALACGGGAEGGVVPPPPPVRGPPSTAVSALEDAAERLVPSLGTCSATAGAALAALRARMSPYLDATRADVENMRAALNACTEIAAEADRDAVRLALDVAVDVLAAVGR